MTPPPPPEGGGRTPTPAEERWARIQELFHAALELPGPDQKAFLEQECAGEADLVEEVLALLEEDRRQDSMLDGGLGGLADDILGTGLPPLSRIGPYQVSSVLGRGGTGVVYLAVREDLGSRAAIKILRDAFLSPLRRERFASEQRMLAQINHPLIARLYDADVLTDGTPYFVMEYVEGVPLTEYCRQHHSSLRDRLRLFRAVCEAVQAAHDHAVVHRDLKPSNILVSPDGNPKLLDFGIAKQLEALDQPALQTETGLRMMTPAYAAPEQILGDPVGTYTDIYALGVILYQLLSGRLPFELSGRTPGQVETSIVERDPERPSTVARGASVETSEALPAVSASRSVWADLDVLCLTAMHKDPARRYRTVDALIRDVDHLAAGEPLEVRPDSVAYRVRKFARRRWRGLAVAAAVVTLVASLTAFYTLRVAQARDRALTEAARAERIQSFMTSLFSGGDEEAGPADSLHVVTLLDRGVHEARVLDGEPEVQADLYQTLGSVYQQLGNLDRADTLLEQSLREHREIFGHDDPRVARTLVALGLLRIDQARLDEADSLIREGLQSSRQAYPPDHPAVIEAQTALGRLLEERGHYDEAVAVLDTVVGVLSPKGATVQLSNSMEELANTEFYAGRLSASDSLNQQLLEMNRTLYGERHPSVGDILINLGAIQFQLGHYDKAEELYRQSLGIVEAYYGPDHPETASNLTMLGRALVYEKRYDEAVANLERALAINERVYGPDHPSVASTLNDLGGAALAKGDYASAEADFERMLRIYETVYAGKHWLVGVAEANLASTYMDEKRYEDADALFRRAIAMLLATLPPDHMQTAITRIKLGHALGLQHRWSEAQGPLLDGYRTLSGQTSPSVSWLKAARKDLAAMYDALGKPDSAAAFRPDADDTTSTAPRR